MVYNALCITTRAWIEFSSGSRRTGSSCRQALQHRPSSGRLHKKLNRPLIRLILNQIARRLTETLPAQGDASTRRLLLMLDEFPALGRLDFFETSLAFLAGYGVRAFLVAQSIRRRSSRRGRVQLICCVRSPSTRPRSGEASDGTREESP